MAVQTPKEVGMQSIPKKHREFKELVNQTLREGSRELRLDGLKKLLEQGIIEKRERYLKAGWYPSAAKIAAATHRGLLRAQLRDGGGSPWRSTPGRPENQPSGMINPAISPIPTHSKQHRWRE